MTIEEKALAYDKALNRASMFYEANSNEGYRNIFEDIFPELKESKDEKILRELIEFFRDGKSTTVTKMDIVTWLEKCKNYKITPKKAHVFWKPTEEQIEDLQSVIDNLDEMHHAIGHMDNHTKKHLKEIMKEITTPKN